MSLLRAEKNLVFEAARHRAQRTRRIRIALPLVTMILVIALSTFGYILIESPHYTFLDALYMTIITIGTVGYREVHPLSAGGQLWTIFVIIIGLLAAGVLISLIGAIVVEGQIRRVFGRRQLETKIKNLSGHVIVCGFGRMGQRTALELDAAGKDVVVVEIDPDRTALAEEAGLLYILGDAQDEDVLRVAGIDQAKELISTLPSDAENVMVALTVRQANANIRIITRAVNTAAQKKLKMAGADRAICPHEIGASRIVDEVLRPALADFVDIAREGVDLELDQIKLREGSPIVGKPLGELKLPSRIGTHVVAIRRASGEMVYHPTPEMTLHAGDQVILIGKRGSAAKLDQLDL